MGVLINGYKMYFDKINHGFKRSDIHGDLSGDNDHIEISEAHYKQLQEKEAAGIAGYKVDENGFVDTIELGLDIDELYRQLEKELQRYLYSNYSSGTQMTLQALYASPTTPVEVKTNVEAIWAWIQSILQYYYSKKAFLSGCEDLTLFSYDFQQFNSSKPSTTLEELINACAGN